MIIRKATLNDIASILDFGRQKFMQSNMSEMGWNSVIARRTIKDAMTDPNQRVFLALKDGNVSGCLIGQIYHMPFSPCLCATDLAFVADQGGNRLVDEFLKWCKSRNVRRIDMGVSQEDRRADNLYLRKGFKRAGGMFYMNLEAA